ALPPVVASRDQRPGSIGPSMSGKLYGWLLPVMPALRTATIAVQIVLLSGSAAESWVVDDEESDIARQVSPVSTMQARVDEQSLPAPAAFEAEGDGEVSDRSAAGSEAHSEAVEEAPAPETTTDSVADADALETAPAGDVSSEPAEATDNADFAPAAAEPGNAGVDVADGSEGESELLGGASASPPATPAAVRDEEFPQSPSGERWSAWRIAQSILLAALVFLGALWLWMWRSARAK
ncbi:MAG: hypothetical protein AB7G88_13280, partial [Thermomicrobiales bacterium]